MTCELASEYIHRLLDGEIDETNRYEIETHLRTCATCAELSHHLAELRHSVRESAPYYTASPYLASRIRSSLRDSLRQERSFRLPVRWMAIAATVICAVGLSIGIGMRYYRNPSPPLVATEIVSGHIRSLQASHLFDIPSSDQHTVKPWFNGKLDFSPNVKDLAVDGFRLAGGRLDYINGHAASALVFQRRQHLINLFEWPVSQAPQPFSGTWNLNGFHIIHWSDDEMTYWAVSDVNTAELQQFVELYRR
jgi:anti-sigma factor RsiW